MRFAMYILCGCVLLFKVLYFSEKKKTIFSLILVEEWLWKFELWSVCFPDCFSTSHPHMLFFFFFFQGLWIIVWIWAFFFLLLGLESFNRGNLFGPPKPNLLFWAYKIKMWILIWMDFYRRLTQHRQSKIIDAYVQFALLYDLEQGFHVFSLTNGHIRVAFWSCLPCQFGIYACLHVLQRSSFQMLRFLLVYGHTNYNSNNTSS